MSYYCNGINEYAESHSDQILDTGIFPVSADKVIEAQHLLEIVGIQLDKPYSYLRGPKREVKDSQTRKDRTSWQCQGIIQDAAIVS